MALSLPEKGRSQLTYYIYPEGLSIAGKRDLTEGLSLAGKRDSSKLKAYSLPEKETFVTPPSQDQGTVYLVSIGYGGGYAKVSSALFHNPSPALTDILHCIAM